MTNTEQTILTQVNGSEQVHEDIQLTELLPVEQSRIQDTHHDEDPATTDGLKLLRSFTQDNPDEFDTQNFKLFRKVDNHGKKRVKFKRDDEKCKDASDDEEKGGKQKGEEQKGEEQKGEEQKGEEEKGEEEEVDDEINTRVMRYNRRIKIDPKNKALKSSWSDWRTSDEDEDDDMPKNKKSKRRKKNRRRKKVKDDLNDEIYHYRQQYDQAVGMNSDENECTMESLSNRVFEDMANNFSNPNVSSESNENIKKTTVKKKKDKESSIADRIVNEKIPAEKEGNDKDLRLKIDVIIKSNYLSERDNTNIEECETNQSENSSQSSTDQIQSTESPREITANTTAELMNDRSSDEQSSPKKEEVKQYCCLMCDAKFKGSGGLRNHQKVVHTDGPLFECHDCGKRFPLKERLKLHVRTHTGFKPYKCTECDKTFARGGQLSQHARTHSRAKPYTCPLCSGTFTCSANLTLHMKRHTGQRDHKCGVCGREFIRRDALKKHLECLHKDVKSFQCVICNKTFKGHLPQHMRTHCQDRPHGCATCGQRFAQKSQLTVHQRTHSGQRPFRCLVCWQAFAHSTALKLHTRRHTGERPFKCIECNAGFTQLPHWKKHMRCIHGRIKPYRCKKCKNFFRIKNDLENHQKTCISNESGDETRDSAGESSTAVVTPDPHAYKIMSAERMRLLLAVLLKRISKPKRLEELGFGKRLIDEILQDSLVSAGKEPAKIGELTERETLRKNLEMFLEWTVPKEHWETFKKMNKTAEEILETLTAT